MNIKMKKKLKRRNKQKKIRKPIDPMRKMAGDPKQSPCLQIDECQKEQMESLQIKEAAAQKRLKKWDERAPRQSK